MTYRYTIPKELKPYIRRILARTYRSCRMEPMAEEGKVACETNADTTVFAKILARAKCEKLTKETGIFQVTKEEAEDSFLLPILLEQAKVTAYQVLDEEQMQKK